MDNYSMEEKTIENIQIGDPEQETTLEERVDKLTGDFFGRGKKAELHKGDPDYWKTYGSSIEDYDKSFRAVLEGGHIVDLVRDSNEPVVVDLMSSTEAIASLFGQLSQSNKLGIAVSSEDDRLPDKKRRDDQMGIKHVPGDLSQPASWKTLKETLGGRKANLILERGGMGVQSLPFNENFYGYVFNRLWEIVSEDGGTILIQGSTTHALEQTGIRVKEWVDLLKSNGVDVVLDVGEDDFGFDYTTLKIVKTPESPKKLPLLR
ncbi:MAG: hypothetical protein HYV90_00865 [Candidatus Woesebacteria bacterium]|nr:MAG: hypothetical protein HYV90_00865 [Candidatus Woesebacteria bacterium]